jgi:GNAT superfamily N-acetyltransferase
LNEILDTYDKEKWIRAIHDNWNSFQLLFGRSTRFELIENDLYTVMSCEVKNPEWNIVMKTRLSSTNVEEHIEKVLEYYSSRELPFSWQIYPGYTPKDLPERLEKHGLIRNEGRGMALFIDDLNIPEIPKDFTYQKVTTPELLDIHARLLPKAYGFPESLIEIGIQTNLDIGIRDDYTAYIGFYEGEPVACSSVLYADGVAGIHSVANVPEARGKGIGSYISALPLFEARERGYKVSTLLSSKMGFNVYKRLGYELYCTPTSYRWNQETE